MMKNIILIGVVLFGATVSEAMALCDSGSQVKSTLSSLLTNAQVCAQLGNDKWQELHSANGDLIDYKRGPNHPVDPSKKVGTWVIEGTGANTIVKYTYSPSLIYTYTVHDETGGNYSFCGTGTTATTITGARFQAAGPCP